MHSALPNDMRNFLFLLRNNTLPLNNRINAFDAQISPMCTFCRIAYRDTLNRDSFEHFFIAAPIHAIYSFSGPVHSNPHRILTLKTLDTYTGTVPVISPPMYPALYVSLWTLSNMYFGKPSFGKDCQI